MKVDSGLRVVVDTNVVFEGLTKRGSAAGLVIEAWLAGLLEVFVSTALAYEYTDVLSRKLSATRWEQIRRVLGQLLSQSRFVAIHFSWRPISPDPADDHVVDCAMNANATVITSNIRHFATARESLGLQAITPSETLLILDSR